MNEERFSRYFQKKRNDGSYFFIVIIDYLNDIFFKIKNKKKKMNWLIDLEMNFTRIDWRSRS